MVYEEWNKVFNNKDYELRPIYHDEFFRYITMGRDVIHYTGLNGDWAYCCGSTRSYIVKMTLIKLLKKYIFLKYHSGEARIYKQYDSLDCVISLDNNGSSQYFRVKYNV